MTPPRNTLHQSFALRVALNAQRDRDAMTASLKREFDRSWNDSAIEHDRATGYAAAISLGLSRWLRLPFDPPVTPDVVTNIVMAATDVLLEELIQGHAAARQQTVISLDSGLSLLMARLDVAAIERALLDVYLTAESKSGGCGDHSADAIGTRLDEIQSARSLFDRELRGRANDLSRASHATEIAWWRLAFSQLRDSEPLPWWLDKDFVNAAAFDEELAVADSRPTTQSDTPQ